MSRRTVFRFHEKRNEHGYPLLVATVTRTAAGRRDEFSVSGPAAQTLYDQLRRLADLTADFGVPPLRRAA